MEKMIMIDGFKFNYVGAYQNEGSLYKCINRYSKKCKSYLVVTGNKKEVRTKHSKICRFKEKSKLQVIKEEDEENEENEIKVEKEEKEEKIIPKFSFDLKLEEKKKRLLRRGINSLFEYSNNTKVIQIKQVIKKDEEFGPFIFHGLCIEQSSEAKESLVATPSDVIVKKTPLAIKNSFETRTKNCAKNLMPFFNQAK